MDLDDLYDDNAGKSSIRSIPGNKMVVAPNIDNLNIESSDDYWGELDSKP